LVTQKIKLRIPAMFPVSVPGINVPATPPKLAVIPVAFVAPMVTMIIAARLALPPMVIGGVVIEVAPH
jgi:hypothetical protein